MNMWFIVSAGSLFLAGGLAAFWVFTHRYADPLLVRIGLSIISIWCLIRAAFILHEATAVASAYDLLHIGMAIFALGFTKSLNSRINKQG